MSETIQGICLHGPWDGMVLVAAEDGQEARPVLTPGGEYAGSGGHYELREIVQGVARYVWRRDDESPAA